VSNRVSVGMRRHPLDLTSLLAGLVLAGIGVAYLVGAVTDQRLDPRWMLPIALIGLGVAGLAGSLTRGGRDRAELDDTDGVPLDDIRQGWT
jgi:hypothetical protein